MCPAADILHRALQLGKLRESRAGRGYRRKVEIAETVHAMNLIPRIVRRGRDMPCRKTCDKNPSSAVSRHTLFRNAHSDALGIADSVRTVAVLLFGKNLACILVVDNNLVV